MTVRPGIEVLVADRPGLVRGARAGLLAHPASVDRDLRHAALLLDEAGADVVRLFAPEHGVTGAAQDMVPVDETRDPVTGLPVVSLYGRSEAELVPRPEHLAGLDTLVVDLQDVGARYYTFAATAIRALPACAEAGVRVIVCDRPNPLGGILVEGNTVDPAFRSFVGELPVPQRHGMTIGELVLFAARVRRVDVELEVVPCDGWHREDDFPGTGLPWVLPSPNMPTIETALVYPGACLLEGTNLSEGRGTTRPFEIVGAPWLDPRALAAALEAEALPGVRFRPLVFTPAFHKHAGTPCGGVQLHVFDRRAFRPVRTGLAVVIAARRLDPGRFAWRTEPYEFVADRPAFDLLAGTDAWRRAIEEGASAAEIASGFAVHEEEQRSRIAEYGLY